MTKTKTITEYRPGIYAEILARQSARAAREERTDRIIATMTTIADVVLPLLVFAYLVYLAGAAWFVLHFFRA